MKKNDVKNITGIYADKLKRNALGNDPKRRITITAKHLYNLLHITMPFDIWCKLIEQSPLRDQIDYQYLNGKLVLTISAMQAILVMINTEHSWQLHHSMTDLIHNGFSTH